MVKNKSVLRSHNMKNISYRQSAHLSSISVIKESDPDESDPDPNSELETILKKTQTALNRELNKMILPPVMQIKRPTNTTTNTITIATSKKNNTNNRNTKTRNTKRTT